MATERDQPTELLPPEPDRAEPAPPVARPPAQPRDSLVGATLGKFEITAQLGRGGSGDVYRAEQPNLGRTAVIKVLRRDVAQSPNKVERFLREAKLASRLDHPYAAHIYAFGAEPDGLLWLAMEHVRGGTLDELLARRGAMPPAVFGPLFGRLCEVVHTAHELGIVHRDIKGSNVMVIERAGQLLPKLLDFGIAKADMPDPTRDHSGETEDDPAITQEGSTLGSPAYMAPEQWQSAADVDARADIYALGALAYRCLAGALPFRDTDRRALATAHQTRPAPHLPDHLPRALDDAVLRALAKRPGERWASALAFGEALRVAVGTAAPEVVPIFDPYTRDVWLRAGPQPIADAIARLVAARTTVEADGAVRDLVAITCRWLAVLALALVTGGLDGAASSADPAIRERLRAVVGRDDALPWLELARAAAAGRDQLPGLTAALAGSEPLADLARALDDRDRARTAAGLANDVVGAAEAMRPLEPLLAYQLVVGRGPLAAAESWQGPRRRDREPVVVWGEPLADGEVVLLDASERVVARLSPLAQVSAPLPSAEPELFVLWRSSGSGAGRGSARLVAAPWGFERDDARAGARLAALTTEDSDTAHDAADGASPYPGLAAYGVDDADRFVGREREVEALANRLVRAPMIAVLGPSGAGKSSFIHAGLLPRLGDQAFARNPHQRAAPRASAPAYRVIALRPGRRPMHALAALPEIGGALDAGLDEASLAARLRELGDSARGGLVVVVDQLEELVTLCGDPDERARFAATLARAADGAASPVRVVATLRDDFAFVLESEAGFRGAFEVFVLGTPLPDTLRRIVVEPARRAAVAFDPDVVDDMVQELAGRPASLPLLSFTAAQLWLARDKQARRITRAAYDALGGVAGALSTYADQLYASLAQRDQDTARALFARLVAADGTRVPVPRAELEQLAGARAVLAHLIDARLLVVRQDDGVDLVEIVHECLAERWTRLARWRQEDAADAALIADLRAAARRWTRAARSPGLLWRGGAQLAELGRLAARPDALTDEERAFADAALAAGRRARRVRRALIASAIAALAIVAGVMAYLGIAANRSAARATTSAQLAEDRLTDSLVAQGRRELNDGRPLNALAYLAAALERGADSRGLRVMLGFAERGWRDILRVDRAHRTLAVAALPHGAIAACTDGVLRFWRDDGAPDGEVAAQLGSLQEVEVARDGRFVAVGREGIAVFGADRARLAAWKPAALVFDVHLGPGADEVSVTEADGLRVYAFTGEIRRKATLPSAPNQLVPVFDAGGTRLYYTDANKLHAIDTTTMLDTVVATDVSGTPAMSADGSTFAYLDAKYAAHVFHAATGAPIRTLAAGMKAYAVVLSATGDRIALEGSPQVELYDVATGSLVGTVELDGEAMAIAIRGDDLYSAHSDGTVRRFARGQIVASVPIEPVTLQTLVLAGDAVAVVAANGALVLVRAAAKQVVADELHCDNRTFATAGPVVVYTCGEQGDVMRVYAGRRFVGELPTQMFQVDTAFDPASGRAALDNGRAITVHDATGKVLFTDAARPGDPRFGHYGPIAFEDADHLLVVPPGQPVLRWTLGTDDFAVALAKPAADVYAIAIGPAGEYVLGEDRALVVVDPKTGAQLASLDTGADRVAFLTQTPDRHWLAAALESGAALVVDATTWQLARRLEPGDAAGGAPTFDASGELMLRQSHGSLAIWDRATGEPLVAGFELLRGSETGGRFDPATGALEFASYAPGAIDIPPDTRSVAAILADIRCRLPLHVVGSRVEPTQPTCK